MTSYIDDAVAGLMADRARREEQTLLDYFHGSIELARLSAALWPDKYVLLVRDDAIELVPEDDGSRLVVRYGLWFGTWTEAVDAGLISVSSEGLTFHQP